MVAKLKFNASSGRSSRRQPVRRSVRLWLEELENRDLPSVSWPGLSQPVLDMGNNNTLDQSQNLGALGVNQSIGVVGAVGNGPLGAAEVDFYQFTLTQASQVQIATHDQQAGSSFVSVLSLYNTDPQDPMGNRLIAQDDGAAHGGDASIEQNLGAGTYYIAVSGTGDRYFYPYLAGSGYPGSTGPYGLSIQTSSCGMQPGDGPAVLSSDPAPEAVLSASPFALRVALSAAIDPTSISPGTTVSLQYSSDGAFSSDGSPVNLASVGFDASTNELVITPGQPLAPGFYQVFLAGDETLNSQVLLGQDVAQSPLGKTFLHPLGQDYTFSFQVNGVEGNTTPGAGADDTPATAQQLGNVTGMGLVQVTGAIGNDSTDPAMAFDPSNVNLYHFQVTGPGNYAFAAEVFAGRIDSPLDPALTLFRQASDGSLQFVTSDGNTGNATMATNGELPLLTDAALFGPLTAGDYYLAVSSGFNYVDPAGGLFAGQDGVFDPMVSHSGMAGNSIGPYVLNLRVDASTSAPHVLSTSVANGAALDGPPSTLSIRFDSPVNVQELAFTAYSHTGSSQVPAVFIRAADGTLYYPRLQSYDPTTNQATFQMLDALPPGQYEWHLSGSQGLTDLAGNPLAGNDPSGDYVVHFTVGGSLRGSPGNPIAWIAQQPNEDPAAPQILGTLFPMELQQGVTITRAASPVVAGPLGSTTDYYQFNVIQSQDYLISLPSSSGLPDGTLPEVWTNGVPLTTIPQGPGAVFVHLDPGTYVVGVNWGGGSSSVGYQIAVVLLDSPETATELTTGAAPALSLRLVTNAPPMVASASTAGPPVAVPTQPAANTLSAANAVSPPGVFLALSDSPLGGTEGLGIRITPLPSTTALVAGPNWSAAQGYRGTVVSTTAVQSGGEGLAPEASLSSPEAANARDFNAAPLWGLLALSPSIASEALVRSLNGMAMVVQKDLSTLNSLFASSEGWSLLTLRGAIASPPLSLIGDPGSSASVGPVQLDHSLVQIPSAEGGVQSDSAMTLAGSGALGLGILLGVLRCSSWWTRRSETIPSLGEVGQLIG